MAQDQNRRLRPIEIRTDQKVLDVIKSLSPSYAPADSRYNLADAETRRAALLAAQAQEVEAHGKAAAARDAANAREWEFHNYILGMKPQIVAQYGGDSDQVQAIGFKKKSEQRRRGRHRAPPPATG
jgi:hypothetical protein